MIRKNLDICITFYLALNPVNKWHVKAAIIDIVVALWFNVNQEIHIAELSGYISNSLGDPKGESSAYIAYIARSSS